MWTLYLVHKDQGWFKDRYSNEADTVNLRIENTKRGKADAVRKYIASLAEGTWDEVNYEASRKWPCGRSRWGRLAERIVWRRNERKQKTAQWDELVGTGRTTEFRPRCHRDRAPSEATVHQDRT